mmetsp:Transcript_52918/g.105144  ORF Transcript_52918/g.105144 Transcript_52918/m.105144 type:complete len:262 (-) Transcript_52918:19-804(-)
METPLDIQCLSSFPDGGGVYIRAPLVPPPCLFGTKRLVTTTTVSGEGQLGPGEQLLPQLQLLHRLLESHAVWHTLVPQQLYRPIRTPSCRRKYEERLQKQVPVVPTRPAWRCELPYYLRWQPDRQKPQDVPCTECSPQLHSRRNLRPYQQGVGTILVASAAAAAVAAGIHEWHLTVISLSCEVHRVLRIAEEVQHHQHCILFEAFFYMLLAEAVGNLFDCDAGYVEVLCDHQDGQTCPAAPLQVCFGNEITRQGCWDFDHP